MGFDEGRFFYTPETDYTSIDAKDSGQAVNLLDDFKKGYIIPLQAHITTADNFRQYLNSSNVPNDLRSAINVKSEEVERELMQIVRLYSQVESRLEPHNLSGEAMHFLHSVFPGEDSTEVKINYLKMIRAFEALRNFNQNVRRNWDHLKEIFEKFKPLSSSKAFLEQILEFKIYPRIELCEKTDFLIRRMQYILKLPDDYETAKKIDYAGNYSSLLNYNIGTIFQTDLDKYIIIETRIKGEAEQESLIDENSCITDPYFLDSRGKMTFNQSYLYTLSINQTRVETDLEKIRKSVYLETHLTMENQSLRQDMIRHFISNAKKKNNEAEYARFLFEHFDFTKEGIFIHLQGLSGKERIIFLYHFGPVFFLKIVMQFLREGHTGYIHRFMGRHHMARELPFEYIKFILKDWWDDNVFRLSTSPERNSREIYGSLVDFFTKILEQEQAKIFRKILQEPLMIKAYNIRDFKMMRPFLELELSYLYYCIFNRFLGPDFLYLPLNRPPKQLVQS